MQTWELCHSVLWYVITVLVQEPHLAVELAGWDVAGVIVHTVEAGRVGPERECVDGFHSLAAWILDRITVSGQAKAWSMCDRLRVGGCPGQCDLWHFGVSSWSHV